MGESFFTEKLLAICLKWLNDPVYSIRTAALTNFRELTRIFGTPWAEKHVLKELIEMKNSKNYLQRLVALFGIAEISKVCHFSMIKTHFLPVLVEMSKDAIPNIRMNIGKAAMTIKETVFNPEVLAAQ